MFEVMAKIERFEDLKCWQEARELCKVINGSILLNNSITDHSICFN